MVSDDERMPRLLGKAAKRYRVEAEVVESEIAGRLKKNSSTVYRFEGGIGDAPGSRVGVEELLDVYVALCELTDRYQVWERAIKIGRDEEAFDDEEWAAISGPKPSRSTGQDEDLTAAVAETEPPPPNEEQTGRAAAPKRTRRPRR